MSARTFYDRMILSDYALVLTDVQRKALVQAIRPRLGEGTFGEIMAELLHKLGEPLPPAPCPCKDPVPEGGTPCTPTRPCPYAVGRIEDLWRAES